MVCTVVVVIGGAAIDVVIVVSVLPFVFLTVSDTGPV